MELGIYFGRVRWYVPTEMGRQRSLVSKSVKGFVGSDSKFKEWGRLVAKSRFEKKIEDGEIVRDRLVDWAD